jgi:hypothetical protein
MSETRTKPCRRHDYGKHRDQQPLFLLVLMLCLWACPNKEKHLEPVTAGPMRARMDPDWPKLRKIIVDDMTEADRRPHDLGMTADMALREALKAKGNFAAAATSDTTACAAEFQVVYGLVLNGEVVSDAPVGQARVLLDGQIYCPKPVGVPSLEQIETFRASLNDQMDFGERHEIGGKEALVTLLARSSKRMAAALYGQVIVRHASDHEIVDTLATTEHIGLLMEAASESGERKLAHAIGYLIKLTSHEESSVALRAGAALGLIAKGSEEILTSLARMTEGGDTERHLVAIHALGDIGGERAARYLDSMAIGHPLEPMRIAARGAAARARAKVKNR